MSELDALRARLYAIGVKVDKLCSEGYILVGGDSYVSTHAVRSAVAGVGGPLDDAFYEMRDEVHRLWKLVELYEKPDKAVVDRTDLYHLFTTWDLLRDTANGVDWAFLMSDFANQMTHIKWELQEQRVLPNPDQGEPSEQVLREQATLQRIVDDMNAGTELSRSYDDFYAGKPAPMSDVTVELDAPDGIEFRDGPTGRRAALVGGPDVREVVAAVESAREANPGMSDPSVLVLVVANTGLTLSQVELALRYEGERRAQHLAALEPEDGYQPGDF